MNKKLIIAILSFFMSYNLVAQDKGVDTTPGKIKIWSNNQIYANDYSYPTKIISGIENLVTLNYNSYYSYTKLRGINNSVTTTNSYQGATGIYSLATSPFSTVGIEGVAVGGDFTVGISGSAKGATYSTSGSFTGLRGNATGDASSTYTGVYGLAGTGGTPTTGTYRGIHGYATGGTGSYNYGVYGESYYTNSTSFAGYFSGKVHVNGTLSKSAGTFKIDHPLDPQNKYLSHSFVESPDMMNIYNGNITTDQNGRATVSLPDYFEALNMDFRYQLTTIGGFANLTVLEEIKGNKFIIASDKPTIKVSWQVTGIRNDAYAKKNRIVPEEDKPASEKGKYLNADAFGLPRDASLHAIKSTENLKE